MLDRTERRVVEAFGTADQIRIVLNEGTEDRLCVNFIKGTGAYKSFRHNLRLAVQQYMNDVRTEASKRAERNNEINN